MSAVVYRVFDKDEDLLYVGTSIRPFQRFSEHVVDKGWWESVANVTLEHYVTSSEALTAETEAIRDEHPRYNLRRANTPVIGQRLQVARSAKGLRQRELAKLLDTDVMQVSKWERGLHRPSDGTLFALAELLGRDFAWFFTEHDLEAAA